MRIVICCMSIWATTVLVGCGQTGALQLPSDPNYDKRAQYLLYKNNQAETPAQNQAQNQVGNQTDQTIGNTADTAIDQPVTSDITE